MEITIIVEPMEDLEEQVYQAHYEQALHYIMVEVEVVLDGLPVTRHSKKVKVLVEMEVVETALVDQVLVTMVPPILVEEAVEVDLVVQVLVVQELLLSVMLHLLQWLREERLHLMMQEVQHTKCIRLPVLELFHRQHRVLLLQLFLAQHQFVLVLQPI